MMRAHTHRTTGWTTLASILLLAAGLAACEGDDGKDGATGPAGPAGTAGTAGTPGLNCWD